MIAFIRELLHLPQQLRELSESLRGLSGRVGAIEDGIEARRLATQEDWAEDYVNPGPFVAHRETPARVGQFAVWRIDAIGAQKHDGIIRVYGRANAMRVVEALNAARVTP